MHDEVRYGTCLDQMVDGFLDRATLNSPSKTATVPASAIASKHLLSHQTRIRENLQMLHFCCDTEWDELWGCFTQVVYQRGLKILNAWLPTVDLCAVIATVEKGKMTCMLHGYLHMYCTYCTKVP